MRETEYGQTTDRSFLLYGKVFSHRSGRKSYIESCFPSVMVRVRVLQLTAMQFSANHEITER